MKAKALTIVAAYEAPTKSGPALESHVKKARGVRGKSPLTGRPFQTTSRVRSRATAALIIGDRLPGRTSEHTEGGGEEQEESADGLQREDQQEPGNSRDTPRLGILL